MPNDDEPMTGASQRDRAGSNEDDASVPKDGALSDEDGQVKKQTATANEGREDIQMNENNSDGDQQAIAGNEDAEEAKHHVFENDDFEQAIVSATWFSRTMPKRSHYGARNGRFGRTRGAARGLDDTGATAGEERSKFITVNDLTVKLLEIEALYSNCMAPLGREWETPEARAETIEAINSVEDVPEFYRQLGLIEQAFCDPFMVTTK